MECNRIAIRLLKLTIMCYTTEFDKAEISLKTKKLIEIDGSEYDYRKYERVFTGRMTKLRLKIIDRFCRSHTYHRNGSCGHDWDCCGCFCGQSMSFEYKHNQVIVSFSQSFNY